MGESCWTREQMEQTPAWKSLGLFTRWAQFVLVVTLLSLLLGVLMHLEITHHSGLSVASASVLHEDQLYGSDSRPISSFHQGALPSGRRTWARDGIKSDSMQLNPRVVPREDLLARPKPRQHVAHQLLLVRSQVEERMARLETKLSMMLSQGEAKARPQGQAKLRSRTAHDGMTESLAQHPKVVMEELSSNTSGNSSNTTPGEILPGEIDWSKRAAMDEDPNGGSDMPDLSVPKVQGEYSHLKQACFATADVGKPVKIKDGELSIDGSIREITWGGAKPDDCEGRVLRVDPRIQGIVTMTEGTCNNFENPGMRFTFDFTSGRDPDWYDNNEDDAWGDYIPHPPHVKLPGTRPPVRKS